MLLFAGVPIVFCFRRASFTVKLSLARIYYSHTPRQVFPVKRAAGLIPDDPHLKKITVLLHVGHFVHSWQRILFLCDHRVKPNLLYTTMCMKRQYLPNIDASKPDILCSIVSPTW